MDVTADGICTASSWRVGAGYGPGGFNRCVEPVGHLGQHCDDWGNLFVTKPKFKVTSRRAKKAS